VLVARDRDSWRLERRGVESSASRIALGASRSLALRGAKGRGNLVSMERQFFVYIMTNRHHTVLYTGVTGDLVRRVCEHRAKAVAGFTRRYNVDKLVFYEAAADANAAIGREKQIKAGSRRKKVALIDAMNSVWRDLYDDIVA
jgi:putative endonuclease